MWEQNDPEKAVNIQSWSVIRMADLILRRSFGVGRRAFLFHPQLPQYVQKIGHTDNVTITHYEHAIIGVVPSETTALHVACFIMQIKANFIFEMNIHLLREKGFVHICTIYLNKVIYQYRTKGERGRYSSLVAKGCQICHGETVNLIIELSIVWYCFEEGIRVKALREKEGAKKWHFGKFSAPRPSPSRQPETPISGCVNPAQWKPGDHRTPPSKFQNMWTTDIHGA